MKVFRESLLCLAVALLLAGSAWASPYPLDQILEKAHADKLAKAGVKTTSDLLAQGGKTKARRKLAKKAGVERAQLKKWVLMADLLRIRGVGPEMSRLLTAAKVPSVAKLRRQQAKSLHARLMKANKAKKISDNPPGPKYVADWIKQARKLRIVVR